MYRSSLNNVDEREEDDCIHEIEVDAVYDLNLPDKPLCDRNMSTEGNICDGHWEGSVPALSMEKYAITESSALHGLHRQLREKISKGSSSILLYNSNNS